MNICLSPYNMVNAIYHMMVVSSRWTPHFIYVQRCDNPTPPSVLLSGSPVVMLMQQHAMYVQWSWNTLNGVINVCVIASFVKSRQHRQNKVSKWRVLRDEVAYGVSVGMLKQKQWQINKDWGHSNTTGGFVVWSVKSAVNHVMRSVAAHGFLITSLIR